MIPDLMLVLGSVCCLGVALDAFQTILLPRRPAGRVRITRYFYMATWPLWGALTGRIRHRKVREQLYSVYGPASLILLLMFWALLLIAGFSLVYFGLHSPFEDKLEGLGTWPLWLRALRMDLYVSGTTLFTLGLGDVVPKTHAARVLIVVESGTGLGFVALVIGYLPVIYQAFSRREVSVAMLDARAGSPPTATELLRRHVYDGGQLELIEVLSEFERWSAEILESHISYPVLCLYRSQHDNQSWLGALVSILDTCALVITTVQTGSDKVVRQAQLTFAMARHALIDLGHVFHLESRVSDERTRMAERLPEEVFHRLCSALGEMEMRLCGDEHTLRRLTDIRALYEPYAHALADYLRLPLPQWVAPSKPDPAKNPWLRVHALRQGFAERVSSQDPLGAVQHISQQSTVYDLESEAHR